MQNKRTVLLKKINDDFHLISSFSDTSDVSRSGTLGACAKSALSIVQNKNIVLLSTCTCRVCG